MQWLFFFTLWRLHWFITVHLQGKMKSITFVSYIKCCENYVLLSKARIGFLYYKSALNDFEAKYRLEFGRNSTKLKCPCVTSQLTNQLKNFHINTRTKQLATKVKYTCLLCELWRRQSLSSAKFSWIDEKCLCFEMIVKAAACTCKS